MDDLHERMHITAGQVSFRRIGTMTGTHPETVRRYMQGQSPSVGFVVRFADAFDVGIDWLLTGRGTMRPSEAPVQSLRGVGLDTLLKAVGDRLGELDQGGQSVPSDLPSGTVEPKHPAEGLGAESAIVSRSTSPIEDIRRRLAERRRGVESGPEAGRHDAA